MVPENWKSSLGAGSVTDRQLGEELRGERLMAPEALAARVLAHTQQPVLLGVQHLQGGAQVQVC